MRRETCDCLVLSFEPRFFFLVLPKCTQQSTNTKKMAPYAKLGNDSGLSSLSSSVARLSGKRELASLHSGHRASKHGHYSANHIGGFGRKEERFYHYRGTEDDVSVHREGRNSQFPPHLTVMGSGEEGEFLHSACFDEFGEAILNPASAWEEHVEVPGLTLYDIHRAPRGVLRGKPKQNNLGEKEEEEEEEEEDVEEAMRPSQTRVSLSPRGTSVSATEDAVGRSSRKRRSWSNDSVKKTTKTLVADGMQIAGKHAGSNSGTVTPEVKGSDGGGGGGGRGVSVYKSLIYERLAPVAKPVRTLNMELTCPICLGILQVGLGEGGAVGARRGAGTAAEAI